MRPAVRGVVLAALNPARWRRRLAFPERPGPVAGELDPAPSLKLAEPLSPARASRRTCSSSSAMGRSLPSISTRVRCVATVFTLSCRRPSGQPGRRLRVLQLRAKSHMLRGWGGNSSDASLCHPLELLQSQTESSRWQRASTMPVIRCGPMRIDDPPAAPGAAVYARCGSHGL